MTGGMEHELEQALQRACRGDAASLSAVLGDARPGLLRFFELRLDAALRRRLEPDDLVQQLLLEAARRLPEWCAGRSYPFPVWLRLLAGQALAEARRRHLGAERRSVAREAEPERPGSADSSSLAERIARSQTSASEVARRNELRERVERALEELGELDREILVMRHFESLSNADAALELGLDPAAASKRFARALARLRPLLGPFAPDAAT
jgi:RNA polymerase sigma-70 factor (ECF subfamily)